MRHSTQRFSIAAIATLSVISVTNAAMQSPPGTTNVTQQISVPFVKNQGQLDTQVAYYARTLAGTVFVSKNGDLLYSIPRGGDAWAFQEHFVGNQLLPQPTSKEGAQITRFQRGHTSQPDAMASELRLGELYDGVEVVLKARDNNMEKIFRVAPGADTSKIRVELDGVNGTQLDGQGRLIIDTGLGSLAFTAPFAFQMRDGKKETIAVAYTLQDNSYGFRVGDYDKTRELIIDPLLASTFVGGSGGFPTYPYDQVFAVLPVGNEVYVGGFTNSPNFPTALGYDNNFNQTAEGFILRLSNDLATLKSATFIGNAVYALTVDHSGYIVATGQTNTGFPKTGGAYNFPSVYDQSGGFIAKFNPDLTNLVAAGVVVQAPALTEVTVAGNGIYFGGRTNNPTLAVTTGVYGPNCNCSTTGTIGPAPYRGYIGRISEDLSTLEVLSYLGGNNVSGIAIAPDASVYVSDGFSSGTQGSVRHFDSEITTLQNSYYSKAQFYGVALRDGMVYTAGETSTALPATTGAYDTTCGTDGACNAPSTDGFVAKFNGDLSTMLALSYLGGSGTDGIHAMSLDANGNVLVAGDTYSSNFPTRNAIDGSYNGGKDTFVAQMSGDLSTLQFGSYLGGTGDDQLLDMQVANSGEVFVSGLTASSNYPTTSGAFDTGYNGGASDGYISKISITSGGGGNNLPPISNAGSDQTVKAKSTVTLDGGSSRDSDGSIIGYQWTQVSGTAVSLKNANKAIASFTAPTPPRGTKYTLAFQLDVIDNLGATGGDQVIITVTR